MAPNNKERYCRNSIIAYILNNVESKLPIKETEILEVAEKDKRLLAECFPSAQKALQKTYGILIMKLPKDRKYICYSDAPAASTLEYDGQQQRHLTLLFIILSFIYMRDCRVEEQELFDFLRGIRLDVEQEHPFFGGNIKKLVTDTFVKQLYLKKESTICEATTETRYLYSWGFRSTLEFNQKDMLLHSAAILNKDPDDFVAQTESLKENERQQMMEVD